MKVLRRKGLGNHGPDGVREEAGKVPAVRSSTRQSGLSCVRWLIVCVGLAMLGWPSAFGQDLPAQEIMRREYFVSRVKDSKSAATMTLINAAGQQRVQRVTSLTRLQDDGVSQMRMVRFLYPPDLKGTGTLTIEHAEGDDDIWVYLPALRKVRRLGSKNKSDSYVGTDFSYGDIIGHRVGDYTHRLIGSETVEGTECFMVESLPVSERVRRDGGYGKRVSWIRKDNFVSSKLEGYDLQGRLFKRLLVTDIRMVDSALGRWQPMRMEMINLETGHRTVFSYDDFKANVGIQQTIFTRRYLEDES